MKKIFLISTVLLAILLLLPLSVLEDSQKTVSALTTPTAAIVDEPVTNPPETFKVLISATNEIKEMPVEDYLFGVVAGEMPALYEEEALKAQAVCAYTFALWRQKGNSDKNYDISDDYTTDQCYITAEIAREKWGSKANEYERKIRNAIAKVKNERLTYNGEIILSVYHAVSSGTTESAKNVWGKDYPYLQAVSSIGDKLANNYISSADLTAEQVCSKLSVNQNESANGFTDFTRTASGTVKTVKFGGKEFKGSQIREAFDLKSSNFEVALKDNSYTFTVYGYGHGVGMSQNGANYMAQQGSSYEEILKHYYTGCQIIRNS